MSRLMQLLCPKARSGSITDVDITALKEQGIEAVILDLDNTLVEWGSSDITVQVRDWVNQVKESGMQIAVASNTLRGKRLASICRELGIENVHRSAKPRRGALRHAMTAMGSRPETTAIIGDQLFTDVLGGNRLGLYTILLSPISTREFIGTRLNRLIERCVLARLERRRLLPPVINKQEKTC